MSRKLMVPVHKHLRNSLVFLFVATFFPFYPAFSQANFSKARHETLSQQDIDVTFTGSTVSFSGAPTTTGWSVTVATTPVPITSIILLSTTTVRLTFDASSVAGHAAAEVFVKPGEAIAVGYDGTGNLTATGGVTAFAGQLSQNNWVFGCNDVKQLSQGKIAGKIIHQCIPVKMDFWAWQYNLSLRSQNSTAWAVNTFYIDLIWNDGSAATPVSPTRVDAALNPSTTYIDPVGLGGSPAIIVSGTATHTFPSSTTGAAPKSCEWDVTILPFANNPFVACPSQSQTTAFANYDTDNANTGTLQLPPLVVGTDNVCLGTNVGMQYNDNTLLNCRLAVETNLPNQADRYVRIVYGSQNNGGVGNIPDVFTTLPAALGGATVRITNNDGTGTLTNPSGYYPTNVGSADNNGVINVTQPVIVPTGTSFMGTIFTTQTGNQVVNQKLWVRIDYWDVCNPYNPASPSSPAPVSISAAITIIANNGAPTVAPLIFCGNQASGTYSMTATSAGPSAGGTFKWYSDATLTTLRLTGATYNPVSSAPNVNKNPAVLTTTNFYVTETIGNGCVSPATTAPFTVVPSVVAGTLSYAGSSPACNGYSPPAITGTAATKGNGTFTYQWQNSPDNVTFANIVGATGLTYTPPVLVATTYYRRVDSSGPCASKNSNVITIQIDQPVTGGSIGSNQTICTGSIPAVLTNTASPTGGNGTFTYQWQSSIVSAAGPFSNIIGATSATYTSLALAQTTFFVRNASSGVCPGAQGTQPSNVITVTVNQVVNGGTVNGNQAICSGSTPTPFTSGSAATGGDGTTYTYLWQQSTVSNSGPWGSATGANSGLAYAPAALTQTTFYQRLATSGVCSSQPSNVITVTVNPLPVASNPTGGGAVCAGNPAADIAWNFTTGTAPFSGTWTGTAGTYNGTYNFSQAGVTLSSTSVTLTTPITLNAGTYKLLTLVDANGCS
ncbi:MAG TPA: hypothetical protein VKQ08_07165, partial [Cyclobacteriaceae bacterium]|nr:hypothetical protein [Cyclobacteriaceae bacterium]